MELQLCTELVCCLHSMPHDVSSPVQVDDLINYTEYLYICGVITCIFSLLIKIIFVKKSAYNMLPVAEQIQSLCFEWAHSQNISFLSVL